ncbi:SGNH/GDSL hydrolase family protein [Paragemmobacter straminiformis]|uniref:SGNH/GDSL hydrolase family protein n=1 Tax=Paragemmobacter straminiformis TaxID=2045119 RepID=A0A842IB45_9RHOB|nr:SGNH/GDSL hydrolase family protein [Gemmobacter straminiformis]MBC2836324.1 SGNH/GDSL hydrolase family protein [Gemmobacter straminiformis]
MLRAALALLALLSLLSCGEMVTDQNKDARILLMGDSMMAANRGLGHSVGNEIERRLGAEVIDRSVIGARYFYYLPVSGAAGLRLTAQYRKGDWDWVVLNGGGNDLLFGCGCAACNRMVDRLISADGTTGAIPDLVRQLRRDGARVVYSGYLRNPGLYTPVRACRPYGDELDRRLTRLAATDPKGIFFAPMSDIVPRGDASMFQFDLIHPSAKGSAAIAARLAKVMQSR